MCKKPTSPVSVPPGVVNIVSIINVVNGVICVHGGDSSGGIVCLDQLGTRTKVLEAIPVPQELNLIETD